MPLEDLLTALAGCPSFLQDASAFLFLGSRAFIHEGYSDEAVMEKLEHWNLAVKVRLVLHDPLLLGFIRVTYDGLVLSPKASLHPTDYGLSARRVQEKPLAEIFRELCLAA